MGAKSCSDSQSVSDMSRAPAEGEFEHTLLGPDYGESIAIQLGFGEWALVDSFLDSNHALAAVQYLDNLGARPAEAVVLIVATHWHDDHIRGIARLVELCPAAQFCCACALCATESVAVIRTLEGNHFSASGSGVRELYRVFARLLAKEQTPIHAIANRLLFLRPLCETWSHSPSDSVFQTFLQAVGALAPRKGEDKTRLPNSRATPPRGAIRTRMVAVLVQHRQQVREHRWQIRERELHGGRGGQPGAAQTSCRDSPFSPRRQEPPMLRARRLVRQTARTPTPWSACRRLRSRPRTRLHSMTRRNGKGMSSRSATASSWRDGSI